MTSRQQAVYNRVGTDWTLSTPVGRGVTAILTELYKLHLIRRTRVLPDRRWQYKRA